MKIENKSIVCDSDLQHMIIGILNQNKYMKKSRVCLLNLSKMDTNITRVGLPRSNDTVHIRLFTVTLRRINGPYTAVISGTEIHPYHDEITARIRPYSAQLR